MKDGGYTIHLTCDARSSMPWRDGIDKGHEVPAIFYGRSDAECVRKARQANWFIGTKRHYCPACRARYSPGKLSQMAREREAHEIQKEV